MGRKNQYSYSKRQRELKKKKKAEEKRLKRLAKKEQAEEPEENLGLDGEGLDDEDSSGESEEE